MILTKQDFKEVRDTWCRIKSQVDKGLTYSSLELVDNYYRFQRKKIGFFWSQSSDRINSKTQTFLSFNYASHTDRLKSQAYEPSEAKISQTETLLNNQGYPARYVTLQGVGYSPELIEVLRKFGNVIFIPQMLRPNGVAGMVSIVPRTCSEVSLYFDTVTTFALVRDGQQRGLEMKRPNLIYPAVGVHLENEPFDTLWNVYVNPFSTWKQRTIYRNKLCLNKTSDIITGNFGLYGDTFNTLPDPNISWEEQMEIYHESITEERATNQNNKKYRLNTKNQESIDLFYQIINECSILSFLKPDLSTYTSYTSGSREYHQLLIHPRNAAVVTTQTIADPFNKFPQCHNAVYTVLKPIEL